MRNRQAGVALLTALLVTALATIAAVAMFQRRHLELSRTQNMLNRDQAYFYLLGAEAHAREILQADADKNAVDYLGETWATRLPPVEIEGGVLQAYLEDLQGRFNLNNPGTGNETQQLESLRIFAGLLDSLQLPVALATQAGDWIDADINATLPDGAEDNHYLRGDMPYRAANTAFRDISEARLLAAAGVEEYERLAPYVCALPGFNRININTFSLPVLHALFPQLNENQAKALLERRPRNGYRNLADFFEEPEIKTLKDKDKDKDKTFNTTALPLTVRSDFFLFHASARIGKQQSYLRSLLRRGENGVEVLWRSETRHPS